MASGFCFFPNAIWSRDSLKLHFITLITNRDEWNEGSTPVEYPSLCCSAPGVLTITLVSFPSSCSSNHPVLTQAWIIRSAPPNTHRHTHSYVHIHIHTQAHTKTHSCAHTQTHTANLNFPIKAYWSHLHPFPQAYCNDSVFANEELRMDMFKDWPQESPVGFEALVRAGFFYTGESIFPVY